MRIPYKKVVEEMVNRAGHVLVKCPVCLFQWEWYEYNECPICYYNRNFGKKLRRNSVFGRPPKRTFIK
jgi:hypothetical protein